MSLSSSAASRTPGSRNRGRDASRQRLLEAAAEVFAETGFTGAKAADIASRAGVAVGTLYLHFTDKDGIARAVALEALTALRTCLREAVARPGLGPEQAARAHAAALVDFVTGEGSQGRLLFAADAPGLRGEILDAMAEAQEAHLRERGKDGYFRTDIDTAVAAQALVGMQSRVLQWWIENPGRASRARVVDTLAKLRLSGIHAGLGEPGPAPAPRPATSRPRRPTP